MIPEFPHFKRIELADRAQLETLLPYTPYSDFVFTNLWCWNINNKRKISLLYGNLVVLMTDYITNRPHLSFYGHRKPVRTARTLLQYAQEHDIELCRYGHPLNEFAHDKDPKEKRDKEKYRTDV